MQNIKQSKIKSGMVEKNGPLGWTADIIIWLTLILCMFIAVIPMWHTLMSSLSEGQQLMSHSGLAWRWVTTDGKPNFAGYEKTLNYSNYAVLKSYAVTLMYVAGNVFFGLIVNVIGGYVLYRRPKAVKGLTVFVMLTIMFSGGMVPTYMVIRRLGLVGTPFALMLPGCTNAMFVVLLMNAFRQVPLSTVEAAEMDGAGHLTTMFRVLLPQATGLTMVCAINTAIMSWNAWFEASIYVPNSREWWPLQLWIKQIVADNQNIINVATPDWDKYLISYCVILIATLPVLIAMPFAQKQLQKGSLSGAVKG